MHVLLRHLRQFPIKRPYQLYEIQFYSYYGWEHERVVEGGLKYSQFSIPYKVFLSNSMNYFMGIFYIKINYQSTIKNETSPLYLYLNWVCFLQIILAGKSIFKTPFKIYY